MNQRDKDRWIAALRSGDYKQLRWLMSNGDNRKPSTAFCCLGVAMNVFHGWDHGEFKATGGVGRGLGLDERLTEQFLKEFVPTEWHVLTDTWADFFVIANDKLGWTFAQIADWAEKYLPVSL